MGAAGTEPRGFSFYSSQSLSGKKAWLPAWGFCLCPHLPLSLESEPGVTAFGVQQRLLPARTAHLPLQQPRSCGSRALETCARACPAAPLLLPAPAAAQGLGFHSSEAGGERVGTAQWCGLTLLELPGEPRALAARLRALPLRSVLPRGCAEQEG